MKLLYTFAASLSLVFISLTGCGSTASPQGGEKLALKVASYNIRYAAAADEQTGNGWDARKLHVANVIKNHDFDIVGTQEGNKAQLADLKGYLPDFDYVGHPYGGSRNTSHNCAIFYKTAKYAVLDEGCFWFSETPDIPSIGWDATDQRICYWAKFRELKTGAEFYFFTAHFYWRYQTARENSGAVLVAKVREIAGDAPVISTGDYNSADTTPQIKTILTLLKDAYDTTETPPVGPEDTDLGGGVFQGAPKGRIDYIFVSNHFRVLRYAVLADSYNNGRYPSDHLPVSAQLSLSL
jgi:endonuclease/exonuclease/phosphatase family metal-dependent hydrolase